MPIYLLSVIPTYMRILLLLIIFALGFGGYSAAAHAFGNAECQSSVMDKASDCLGHKAIADASQDQNDSAGDHCIDCGHCCPSHAIHDHYYSGSLSVLSMTVKPLLADTYQDSFLLSLLRPPRNLV